MPIQRIPPQQLDGKPVDLAPPCGGSWSRDADGGLTPADEATARAAGLWEEPMPEPTPEPTPEPVAAPASTKKTAKD